MFTMRSILLALFVTTGVPMWAAQLRVRGTVTEHGDRIPMSGVLVRIYKDGIKQHVFTTDNSGRYNVKLDNNANYVIRFSGEGLVTKSFAIDTHGPEWEDDSTVKDLEVEMTMFEKVPGLDLSFFDLPMGMAKFTPMTGMIAWNATYEERVRPEVDRLMAEIAMRREQVAALIRK